MSCDCLNEVFWLTVSHPLEPFNERALKEVPVNAQLSETGNWGGNVQTCKVATFRYQISWTDSQTKWEICGRPETKRGKEKPSDWIRNGYAIRYESSDLGSMNGNLNKGREYCSLRKGTRTIVLVSELYWVLIVFSSVAQSCPIFFCDPCGCKEFDTTERLNWTELIVFENRGTQALFPRIMFTVALNAMNLNSFKFWPKEWHHTSQISYFT